MLAYIAWFKELTKEDLLLVGGKGANLGELTRAGFPVPPGFVVTVDAYRSFLKEANLEQRIAKTLAELNVDNTEQLHEAARKIQELILQADMPDDIKKAIVGAYRELCKRVGREVPVAVRSSATAEDLPTASFAGQQASFLNVVGERKLVESVQKCWASLFTPRAIFYREKHGIDHSRTYIAVAIQQMVQAEAAGVLFTAHPTTGDRDKVVIESTWGLGESLVAGEVTPDRFVVDKSSLQIVERQISDEKRVKRIRCPKTGKTIKVEVERDKIVTQSLPDDLVKQLAEIGRKIEEHYRFPQDIEWAVEGGKLCILQTRAVTVLPEEREEEAEVGAPLLRGVAASPGVGIGPAKIILDVKKAASSFSQNDILVTKMTNPDWVPLMKKASAIVTDEGGITCHAAIVSRELGIPCVVGTRQATIALRPFQAKTITVDGSHGVVYGGAYRPAAAAPSAPATGAAGVEEAIPVTATKVYVNLSIPELAEKVSRETKPDGVGLLRAEHMMLSIGKHPRKLIEEGGEELMVNAFAEGIRKVAEAFYPRPVVYRFLDFKPDEFLGLEGGEIERKLGHVGPNPMLGYRGAFRYRKEPEIFRLECRAIAKVREEYGLKNVWVMIPFVRTLEDVAETKRLMKEEGLRQGPDFELWLMVEVPSTVFLIDEFLDLGIDGVSFGTNDLTMLILGIDRGDASVAEIYDERNLGVLRALSHVIRICREREVTTSICGQAPSVYPEYCEFLVREGVTSLSVNPDAVVPTRKLVASIEQRILLEGILGFKRERGWKLLG